jgi:acetyl esterase/lipase
MSTVYSIAWSLYLLFAQSDPPTNVSLPFLPLSPVRCTKVTLYFLRFILDSISARGIDLFFDLQVRRVMVLGGKGAKKIIKENVLYAPGKRLDVYLPASRGGLEREDAAPVIVILGGGNWSFWRKRSGAQIALRLRRLGYVVVVPEIAQWPKARLPEMVQDLRHVLEWAGERVEGYGGDGERIFLLVSRVPILLRVSGD